MAMSICMKAALYVRGSRSDGSQSLDNQRPEVEQLARARGFEIAHVYEEQASAAKKRPVFDAMMAGARRGRFRALVVWPLGRFGPSMVGNMTSVAERARIVHQGA